MRARLELNFPRHVPRDNVEHKRYRNAANGLSSCNFWALLNEGLIEGLFFMESFTFGRLV